MLLKTDNLRRGAAAVAACLVLATAHAAADELAVATFAGGCFWCTESDFDKVEGVVSTTSGFIGGHKQNPTYKEVSSGGTGHTEAVQIRYDPDTVSYQELLDVFWVNHDPTTNERQFCDRGSQYRPGVFYYNDEQKRQAQAYKEAVESEVSFPVVTEITEATEFYPAEEYHQDYYKKNPLRYKYYRFSCGRDKRLEELWGEKEAS